MKKTYKVLAEQFGIRWKGRRYDRSKPTAADDANQAINHAATAVQAAATIAVAAVSALPQLGFIHEDSDQSFVLDVADIYRDSVTLPIAFAVAKEAEKNFQDPIDRLVRKRAAKEFRKQKLISAMIDRIKDLLAPPETAKE